MIPRFPKRNQSQHLKRHHIKEKFRQVTTQGNTPALVRQPDNSLTRLLCLVLWLNMEPNIFKWVPKEKQKKHSELKQNSWPGFWWGDSIWEGRTGNHPRWEPRQDPWRRNARAWDLQQQLSPKMMKMVMDSSQQQQLAHKSAKDIHPQTPSLH